MMQTTDDLGMPVSSDISHDCAVSSGLVLFSQNHIVHLVNVFIHAGTSRSAAAPTSVHCARVSELFEQPVNAACPGASFRGAGRVYGPPKDCEV